MKIEILKAFEEDCQIRIMKDYGFTCVHLVVWALLLKSFGKYPEL